jgi:tetratricopeptide (TPR) repeat protein
LPEQFTQREVSRIVGVEPGRLRYWQRLRLVQPQRRWGQRFYNFGDLVALRCIKDITARRIPARKLWRAVAVLRRIGQERVSIGELQLFASGRQVASITPGPDSHAIEPLTGQFLLPFHSATLTARIRPMDSRTAEELFEHAMAREADPKGIEEAVQAYRRVIAMRPEWFEPHINLGCLSYQMGRLEEASEAYRKALEIAPDNAIAHFNLGCALDEMGEMEEAIAHLSRAVQLAPEHADAHFNLASAFEKHGDKTLALEHWIEYLRFQPQGPWADYARTRLDHLRARRNPPPPIPIRPGT